MVLTKEEFLSKIKERIGENPTDEDISFVEDMTDTIDSLSQGDDWKKKFEENDAMWRKKYTERFFTPDKEPDKEPEKEPEETKDSEEIVLPVTRYDNVMNSPHLVETPEARPGAPFHLLETDSETLTASEIRRLAGGIL